MNHDGDSWHGIDVGIGADWECVSISVRTK